VTRVGHFGWLGHNAFGPTNYWPVCSLVLGYKTGATRYYISRPKCTKFAFIWAPLQTQLAELGELTTLPHPYVYLTSLPLREGRRAGGEWKGRGGKVNVMEGERRSPGKGFGPAKNFDVVPYERGLYLCVYLNLIPLYKMHLERLG